MATVNNHLLPYKPKSSSDLIKMVLLANDLFKDLEPYCISHLTEKMEFEEHLEGEVIITEGSAGEKLCILECKKILKSSITYFLNEVINSALLFPFL